MSEAAARLLDVAVRSGITPKSKSRRGIRSANKGNVLVGRPPRWIYPTFLSVNGTTYTDGGAGNLIYTSDGGAVLNLTSPE